MRAKFVRVWDYSRGGSIPFIVLQVEESDTFLTRANFNPGYKFIIQAWYNRVGAAGGHKFNPYYNENVQEKSRKIDTNEADALGFYLGGISNIYDIPENLYTENFWDVVWTSRSIREDKYEGDEDYYKLLLTTGFSSVAMMMDQVESVMDSMRNDETPISVNTNEWMEMLTVANNKMRKQYDRMGFDINEMTQRISYVVVDKKNLSIIEDYWSSNNERNIAEYLWLPFDEMPSDVFQEFIDVHDDYRYMQILDLNNYS